MRMQRLFPMGKVMLCGPGSCGISPAALNVKIVSSQPGAFAGAMDCLQANVLSTANSHYSQRNLGTGFSSPCRRARSNSAREMLPLPSFQVATAQGYLQYFCRPMQDATKLTLLQLSPCQALRTDPVLQPANKVINPLRMKKSSAVQLIRGRALDMGAGAVPKVPSP